MLVRIAAVLLSLALLPAAAHADRRVALVVGNSAYQHTPKLANPKNDATDVSAALKALGFQVIDGFDLDKAAFDRKVRDFATGKLSTFQCEDLPETGRLLVVDDICDGGGTFMGLAQATGLPKERLDLWVSHGVFSRRAAQITSAYGCIFTTDSHPGHRNPDLPDRTAQ